MTATTTAFEATVLDPRRDPEPADWADFTARHGLPAPWDYGLLGVESSASPSPNLLTLLRSGGRLVGAVTALAVRPLRLGPSFADTQMAWLSGVPGWVFDADLDPADRLAARAVYERAVRARMGGLCAGVVYRDVPEDGKAFVSGRGRVVKEAMGTAVLDNTFASFEAWLAGLTKSRRSSVRGQIKKIANDPDLVVRTASARTDLDAKALADLLGRHRARFGRNPVDWRGAISAAYLDRLVRREDVFTTSYHDASGRLLAFAVMLDSPGLVIHQHWAALTPEEGGRKHLYYEAFTRVVRHTIEHGRPALSAGRGLLEPKMSMGLTVRPIFIAAAPWPVCR